MSLTTHRSRPFSSSQRLPEPEQPPVLHEPEEAGALLAEFIHRYPRLLILTGAGKLAEYATERRKRSQWRNSTK
jgi:hypothetical protein